MSSRAFVPSAVLAMAIATAVVLSGATALPANRVKRMSDQRLAELQTLVAMGKLGGKVVTHKVGYGQVDPMKVGRRRRSDPETLHRLQELLMSAASGYSQDNQDEENGEEAAMLAGPQEREARTEDVLQQLIQEQRQQQQQHWWSRPYALQY